jgi:predicted ATPase
MVFLKELSLKHEKQLPTAFPFSLPLFSPEFLLELTTPVTLLVGENGSGKSTLLEGLAVASERVVAGADELADDESLPAARLLAKHLRLGWQKRTSRGFFLRAEDFFGYCRRLNRLHHEMDAEAEQVRRKYREQDRSDFALGLALGSLKGESARLRGQYERLEFRSHGESFLQFFSDRLSPDGFYLLDEPETPLSPQNQLAFLAVLATAVADGSQFVIATHSPILMAYPGARIIDLDQLPPQVVAYEELQHVNTMRRFLNNPEAYLGPLFREDI